MRESGEWTEQVETWSFEPDGRLRVTIASRGSNRPDTTVSRLYRRATRLRDSWTPGPRRDLLPQVGDDVGECGEEDVADDLERRG